MRILKSILWQVMVQRQMRAEHHIVINDLIKFLTGFANILLGRILLNDSAACCLSRSNSCLINYFSFDCIFVKYVLRRSLGYVRDVCEIF